MRATTTPVGNSVDGMRTREAMSAQIKRMEPKIADKNTSFLWLLPTINLATWGMMRPIKPIIPLT